MKVINQSYSIIEPFNLCEQLELIERAARNCYLSEPKSTQRSAFIRRLVNNGHNAMLEFGTMTVHFITSRAVTHELVRHRLCSFAQESTYYCKYKDDLEFVRPANWDDWTEEQQQMWLYANEVCELQYKGLLKSGATTSQARSVLNNSLKASIYVKANFREWRHLFGLRDSDKDHYDIHALVHPLHDYMCKSVPEVFEP
jgi:thymidylate synthase (FAD)